jgi:hypothetical protein
LMVCVSLNFDCFIWLLLDLILPEVSTLRCIILRVGYQPCF